MWGAWLRYLSLDEIPQLVNVINGEMSIVGPRPLPVQYGPQFDTYQHQRHQVKPGLTGWAQVNGRKTLSLPEKVEFDLYYIEKISFLFDLKIMISTYRVLFHPLNVEER
jgi:lipopolysaccharide/colanic/teichoic acid biosynthesis glycosyltransferase